MTDTSDTQTIQCAGDLSVSAGSATCSVDFTAVSGLISAQQCGELIAAIAVCYLLKRVFDLLLSLMGFRS